MAMAQLARRRGLRPRAAPRVAGVLPVGAVLLYRYGLHGSIKEVLVVALMATAAALAREALDRELSFRLAVLIALCGAALLHVFSAVGAVYGLVLGLLLLAVALAEGRGMAAVGRLAGVGVAIAVLAVAVNLSDVKASPSMRATRSPARAVRARPTSGICFARCLSIRWPGSGSRATTASPSHRSTRPRTPSSSS